MATTRAIKSDEDIRLMKAVRVLPELLQPVPKAEKLEIRAYAFSDVFTWNSR
jgi:hypothetical protein